MIARYTQYVLFVIGTALIISLVACSASEHTAAPSTKSTSEVLHNSSLAMQHLKSAHFAMNSTTTVNVPGDGITPHGMTINLKDSGDEIPPAILSVHLIIGPGAEGQNIGLAEIIIGPKVYIQNAKGKWYVFDARTFAGTSGDPLAGAKVANYNLLLALAQKASIKDHGNEALNGENLRHITVYFNNDMVKDLLTATGQMDGLPTYQRANFNQLRKNIKLDKPTLDLWIDETTSYVHRLALTFEMSVDMNGLVTPTTGSAPSIPSIVSTSVSTTIDYSKFNKPVTITPPRKPTPANTISQVFT